MKPELQRIVIAEACGFSGPYGKQWLLGEGDEGDDLWEFCGTANGQLTKVPDYLNDLNAMHDAKRKLLTDLDLCCKFNNVLIDERPRPAPFETDKWTWCQSAEVEGRALIKTIGKWEELE